MDENFFMPGVEANDPAIEAALESLESKSQEMLPERVANILTVQPGRYAFSKSKWVKSFKEILHPVDFTQVNWKRPALAVFLMSNLLFGCSNESQGTTPQGVTPESPPPSLITDTQEPTETPTPIASSTAEPTFPTAMETQEMEDLPDLAFVEIKASLDSECNPSSDKLGLDILIQNFGAQRSEKTSLYIGVGNYQETLELSMIYPNRRRYYWIPVYEQGQSIEVILDPDNLITETNEENNTFQGFLPLPTSIPATCTQTPTTRPTITATRIPTRPAITATRIPTKP